MTDEDSASTEPAVEPSGLTFAVDHPEALWVDRMPGTSDKPQRKTMQLRLNVTNEMEERWEGSAPTTTVVRFTVSGPQGEVIYETSPISGQAITPVVIDKEETQSFPKGGAEEVVIEDIRKFENTELKVEAVFIPTSEVITSTVPVRIAQ